MNNDYVKVLEDTIENLKNKLDDCTIKNEKLLTYCRSLEVYKPQVFPVVDGYLIRVNQADVASIRMYKRGLENEVVGYTLFIKDKNINTFETVDAALEVVDLWFRTGNDGTSIGY